MTISFSLFLPPPPPFFSFPFSLPPLIIFACPPHFLLFFLSFFSSFLIFSFPPPLLLLLIQRCFDKSRGKIIYYLLEFSFLNQKLILSWHLFGLLQSVLAYVTFLGSYLFGALLFFFYTSTIL